MTPSTPFAAWPATPAALRELLDRRLGPLQPPIRSEIFGLQRFAEHGRSLAITHRAARAPWYSATFFPRVRSNIRMLRATQQFIAAQSAGGHDLSPAAEWLLDNFHIIEAQIVEIHEDMPRSYFRELPVLQDEPLAGLPRIYGVAWAFVAHTDGAFDVALLLRFLAAYQDTRELGLGEAWALPTTLRVVLIENLRRLAEREAAHQAARALANLCCDDIEQATPHALDAQLAALNARGVGAVFLTQMAQRLRDRAAEPHGHVDAWLRRALPDAIAALAQQNADQTADNLSVGNAIASLRAIGDADWPDIVAHCSPLMGLMLGSRVFAAEHPSTRDQTLHAIERLAWRSGHSELTVARRLLGLLDTDTTAPASTCGHWLHGAGRPALLRTLRPDARPPRSRGLTWQRAALPAYLLAILAGTVAVLAGLLQVHGVAGAFWLTGLAALLVLFPASEAVVAVIHRLASESVRPRRLPRLELVGGLLPEHRVMVVVPAMLTDGVAIEVLVHRLLLHHLANPENQTQFALLSDWTDADAAQTVNDGALLACAVRAVGALNLAHPAEAGAAPRFIVLHRERRFSDSEQRWIGWERKRGKLELLVDALFDGRGGAFLALGEISRIAPDTRYVVTLDSDTVLPPGRLRELVGVAAHPLNVPRLDATGQRVIAGYGILQPRVLTPLPPPALFTPYHWLFAGQCGIDPYSSASSEIYQDLFGEGSFTGKGLLHVGAMHAALSRRLPEGRVLSHDLLEGALARCATVSDLVLIEDAPYHADVAAARVHRWIRGDWQLLPFLLAPRAWPLGMLNRWKMLDNLRRSLVAPLSLLLLLLALAGWLLSPPAALLLVVTATSAGPLMGALAGWVPRRAPLAVRHFCRQAAFELARAVGGGLWQLVHLLPHALRSLEAIGQALYRMAISHRHLLQWTPSSSVQARATTQLTMVLHRHRRLPWIALLLFSALLAAGTPTPLLAAMLCLLWAASPLATWWGSRPLPAAPGAALPPGERAHLQGIARDTWRFFERCVTAADHHLPPDNLQTAPHEMLAHRTSPTNIGLYLLAIACAQRFGWIGREEMLARLEATLGTLAGLPRHRGHFLNWYDTRSLAPLPPLYVSTVDSGNLSGHLLAVAQACRELLRGHAPADAEARLQRVADTCEALAWQPDFAFLYHRSRHLLHIGYRVAEQQLDAGFYDLLASESRLTSLLAIAKGDIPVRHWAALGRPFYAVGNDAGLRSWSGSMFEYLMPSLVLDEPHGSLLHQACRAALQEQIAFAAVHGVPWGISESAYAASDHTLAYQYAPQGVPRLALRRTPSDELVIAPYACALAAQIDAHAAHANFTQLEQLGARAMLGFIEALDYSPARQTADAPFAPVQTFMAHHQGMTVVALANVLLDGAARRWGMGDPRIEAVASLLHERAPSAVSTLREPPAVAPRPIRQRRSPGLRRELAPGAHAVEPTQLLSNGRYNVALRANGAGWSRWGDVGVTRWRDDALRDAFGSFFFIRGAGRTRPVSITQHPAPDPQAQYKAVFHADRVCFDALWPDLQVHTTVWVSPEDDIEFRQIEATNLGDAEIEVELISAFEITLADPRADEAHPAFGNLFVQAGWQVAQQALVFERRPRLASERALCAAHFMAESDARITRLGVQADRRCWAGRNRAPGQPLAAFDALPSGAGATAMLDTGLDPVCALSVQLRIAPGAKAKLTFATAACADRGTLHAVIDKYRQVTHVQRASLMSTTLAGIRARTLRLGAQDFEAIQTLTTALLFTLARPASAVQRLADDAASVCDRRLLWRFGISGDRPLIGVSASALQGIGLLRSLAQALRLWTWSAIACDVVVINGEPASYQMALQRELAALRESLTVDSGWGHAAAALHVLRADDMSPDEVSTLRRLARVWLQADGRALPHHVQAWSRLHQQHDDERRTVIRMPIDGSGAAQAPLPSGRFDSATGGFVFEVGPGSRPRRPWINVLSNPDFGTQVSEAGGGYSWARNSRLNQLTPWSNDPVNDPPSEWCLLQDPRTLEVWSVSPSAAGADGETYGVEHRQGSTTISHRRNDLSIVTTWCVDAARAIKQVRLQITNRGRGTRVLRAVGIVEWMMGATRADRGTVVTAPLQTDGGSSHVSALLCTQPERTGGFGDGTAFFTVADGGDGVTDWTCDRRECFDSSGRVVLPQRFGRRSGHGLDPCAAISTLLRVGAGESAECVFLLGYGDTPEAARQLAAAAAAASAIERLARAEQQWDRLLGATTVRTPDPLFDTMVNRWLLYQTVSCRLWAKAGFYQAGGATGFRDQLQDAMALVWAAPEVLRAQILLCASRQFAEGDVQHWWHAPTGAGVRTHFSDDLLWLAQACVHYLQATGDAALLDEQVAFIEGSAIPEGAEDAYFAPAVSSQRATVYEHAARAIDRSLRVGVHGLPLMGSGDWNDGMNRVGHGGRGESVWLGWFLCRLVADFAPLARERGDDERASRWESAALGWRAALLGTAWDGQWFTRAFFDDGQALGSQGNVEARIDLIAQAWAVLSRVAPRSLQHQAMASAERWLVDAKAGLIRLLDPPLQHADPSAGYIQAYPPGVRENGGQYSHAAVWALMAQAELARADGRPGDAAYRDFKWLSPAHRAADPVQGLAYGLEPYVMAGDVYSQPPYTGRGGWSWYTGAAAWLHRAAIESIFGLRLGPEELSFEPCLPSAWPSAEITLRRDGHTLHFVLRRMAANDPRSPGVQLLQAGQALRWRALAGETSFVVALGVPGEAAHGAAADVSLPS